MRIITKGATSKSVYIVIRKTDGTPYTGLVFNTASLTAAYTLNGAAAVSITLATLASASAAWSSGGFKEVDATKCPGLYRLDVPNASLTGADSVVFNFAGISDMDLAFDEIQLTGADLMDTVRGGLTALPNVASGSAGAIPTTGTGANQISLSSGQTLVQAGTGAGQLDFTSGVVKANLAQILGTALTETAGQIAAAFKQFFNIASPTSTMNRVTLVDTVTTNTDMRGTDNAATAASVAALNNLSAAQVRTEARGAIADYGGIL